MEPQDLLAQGYWIHIKDDFSFSNLDKHPSRHHNNITTIGDVRKDDDLNNSLKGKDLVVLLAAEHRDDVSPTSLYYDVNVEGARNILKVMDKNGVKRIIFTSSVTVYGLNKQCPDESHSYDPFNYYGKSKLAAEDVLCEWYNKDPGNRSLTIIRPTVIFGERNRGNVYNLLKQISSGKFLMIGKGNNKKSMAYVGNIVALIKDRILKNTVGYEVFNYVDIVLAPRIDGVFCLNYRIII